MAIITAILAGERDPKKLASLKDGRIRASCCDIAAQTLSRSHSASGAYYRRMRTRLGAPQAITATAHKLALIVTI